MSDSNDDIEKARQSSLFVGSLEKGLEILQTFDREQREMGLFELVEASGLDKSSVQRFTHTLHTLGYLRKDSATKKYSLSPKVLELGFSYLNGSTLLEHAMPVLYEINSRSGESVNITELLDTEVVYIGRVPGRHVISVDIFLGMRFPAYATAPGRAMLAHLPEAEAADILTRSDLRKFTDKTLATKAALQRELAQIRRDGYAVAEEQCYLDEISVAAPVTDFRGRPIAALNISAPFSRWEAKTVREQLAPLVIEGARSISLGQGGRIGHSLLTRMATRPRATGKPVKAPTTRNSDVKSR